MKKQLLMFFLLTFLCFPILSQAFATNSNYDNIKVYSFYNKNNDEVKEWLEEELKDNSRVKVEFINVDSNKNLDTKVRKTLNIKKDKLPLMVIGSNYFIGFNNKTKQNLTKAIKAYEKTDNYCDVVSKIKDGNDVKDCINQNKGIYNQPSQISTSIKVILIIIGIGLIVGIVLIIWKKEGNKLKIKLKNK